MARRDGVTIPATRGTLGPALSHEATRKPDRRRGEQSPQSESALRFAERLAATSG